MDDVANDSAQTQYSPARGFPGYFIGDDGSVWSQKAIGGSRDYGSPPRKLKLTINKIGYLQCAIHAGDKQITRFVHRLVLEAFVGPRPKGGVCRHLDGNPLNNKLNNLCWGTQKENLADRLLHGTVNRGERNGQSKLTADQVLEIKRIGRTVTQDSLAAKYGVNRTSIGRVLRGVDWGHVNTQEGEVQWTR